MKKKSVTKKQKRSSKKLPLNPYVIGSAPVSDFHKYDKVICTDEDGKAMAWGGEQLCYCTNNTWQDEHFPLKVYTKKHAQRLIARTQLFRKGAGFDVPQYRLVPVG